MPQLRDRLVRPRDGLLINQLVNELAARSGRLIGIAPDAGLPSHFSANVFMRCALLGEISSVRLADHAHFGGLNAALDSTDFVIAAKYRGYARSVEEYLNLVKPYD